MRASVPVYALLLGLMSCTARTTEVKLTAPVNALSPSAMPVSRASPSTSAVKTVPFVATLNRFKTPTHFRRREKLSWEPAETGLSFYRKDALQTQAGASAEVGYQSGSVVNLQENTLIVIDEEPRTHNQSKEDRATLREGNVESRAKREFWLLTAAGLVKLKPTIKAPTSVAAISAKKNSPVVAIDIREGEGAIVTRTSGGILINRALGKGKVVEIKIGPKTDWETYTNGTKIVAAPPPSVAHLELFHPTDQEVVSAREIIVDGKLVGGEGKILVNGKSIEMTLGAFKTSVALAPGANVISFQLIRQDGTTEFKRVTVLQKSEDHP